jgi:hypothetical protein
LCPGSSKASGPGERRLDPHPSCISKPPISYPRQRLTGKEIGRAELSVVGGAPRSTSRRSTSR